MDRSTGRRLQRVERSLRRLNDHTPGVPGRRWLFAVWVAAAAVLIAVLVVFQVTRVPGDDPDPGRQRPGILDLHELPRPAPQVPGVDLPEARAVVVFFAGRHRVEQLCRALAGDDELDDEAVILITSRSAPGCPESVDVVETDLVAAAAAFGLPEPRGDVEPTGYAVVDAAGRLRYRTLDPFSAHLLDEVDTMLGAVQ